MLQGPGWYCGGIVRCCVVSGPATCWPGCLRCTCCQLSGHQHQVARSCADRKRQLGTRYSYRLQLDTRLQLGYSSALYTIGYRSIIGSSQHHTSQTHRRRRAQVVAHLMDGSPDIQQFFLSLTPNVFILNIKSLHSQKHLGYVDKLD